MEAMKNVQKSFLHRSMFQNLLLKTKERNKLANMNVHSPIFIKISLCVIVLLFVCERVAYAQQVAPEDLLPEEVAPEDLLPADLLPEEVTPEDLLPEDLLPEEVAPEDLLPEDVVPWEDATKKEKPESAVTKKEIVSEEFVVTNEHKTALMQIVASAESSQRSGSAFACKYRNREFIATSLHIIEGISAITVTSVSGISVGLSNQMIISEDADICLIAIRGSFAELGIVPFEFMDDALKGSKSGDKIICLGSDLGKNVITTTNGKIKSYGRSSVVTDAPAVEGNFGGPIIHRDSRKVIAIISKDIVGDEKPEPNSITDEIPHDSTVRGMPCFGHRIDSVTKWKSLTFEEIQKSSLAIEKARKVLDNIYNFLTDKPGWRDDRSLATAWDNYEKFIEKADAKSTKITEAPDQIDEFTALVARISGIKRKGVSQGDYDKARLSIIKALDWKVQATQDEIKKSTPVGSKQIEAINDLKTETQQIADAIKKL